MASDLKRWESGVIAGVRAVTPAGAATSLASANSEALPGDIEASEKDIFSIGVADIIEKRLDFFDAKPISTDEAVEAPVAVRAKINHVARRIRTNGDGTCAVHGVFGAPNPNGQKELFCVNSRNMIREHLQHPWALIARRLSQNLATSIQSHLWTVFLLLSVILGLHSNTHTHSMCFFFCTLFVSSHTHTPTQTNSSTPSRLPHYLRPS